MLQIVRLYKWLLQALFGFIPALAIAYVWLFSDPAMRLESHAIHEAAIAIAILTSSFIAYITWRCYQHSREPFLRWLTLGFLGFTLVYLPHGLLTRTADHNMFLFLLYGPASRLTMMVCFIAGMLHYGSDQDTPPFKSERRFWMLGVILFLAIDLLVAILAYSPVAGSLWLRMTLEGGALSLALVSSILLLARRPTSPLMLIYLLSLVMFMQSSVAFMLAKPWDHQWWLAHAIFAAGFFLLSYGVAQAYLTTRSFATVYSVEQILEDLRQQTRQTETALQQLEQANQGLRHLAATDFLTGLTNRRKFMGDAQRQILRSRHSRHPLALLALDIDHFKQINDRFGHGMGDQVLRKLAESMKNQLRPADLLGRVGGEEFLALLPKTGPGQAGEVAERLRQAVERDCRWIDGEQVDITLSVGFANAESEGYSLESLMKIADDRLYQAKAAGRNRVVGPEAG